MPTLINAYDDCDKESTGLAVTRHGRYDRRSRAIAGHREEARQKAPTFACKPSAVNQPLGAVIPERW